MVERQIFDISSSRVSPSCWVREMNGLAMVGGGGSCWGGGGRRGSWAVAVVKGGGWRGWGRVGCEDVGWLAGVVVAAAGVGVCSGRSLMRPHRLVGWGEVK